MAEYWKSVKGRSHGAKIHRGAIPGAIGMSKAILVLRHLVFYPKIKVKCLLSICVVLPLEAL